MWENLGEYLIKKFQQQKIILVIVMLSCTVLCAIGFVYLFENLDQSNWLFAALWALVVVFGARDVYIRCECFRVLDSLQTKLKSKSKQWFTNILTQAANKDCDLDKEKKQETGANHNHDGEGRKEISHAIVETIVCLFWLAFCVFCCCQGEIIFYITAFFAGIAVLYSAWFALLFYRGIYYSSKL